jgi:uncharacterized protein (DUF952 family)
MNDKVYKIFTESEWRTFQADGRFKGSENDLRDGFIHFSAKQQVDGVIERYFTGVRPLYIAAFSSPRIMQLLKWEISDSKEVYPHLYDVDLLANEVVDFIKL